MRTFRTHIFIEFRVLTADGFRYTKRVGRKFSVERHVAEKFVLAATDIKSNSQLFIEPLYFTCRDIGCETERIHSIRKTGYSFFLHIRIA